jgi:hypothetical protein
LTDPAAAADVLRRTLTSAELEWEEPSPCHFVVTLAGSQKLKTACSLILGDHALSVNAFVARRPDENQEAVYRWLLERNSKAYGVAFAVDHHGDIYLSGRVALECVTPEEVDRLLGAVLDYADGSFNRILELGFQTAIRREWEWRRRRGESTANLAAFSHLVEPGR